MAAQCVIDLAMRIRSVEQAPRSADGATAIRGLAELGVLDAEEAASLAPLAGFRNVLAHEYTDIDWDLVYGSFDRLDELERFGQRVRAWLRSSA